MVTLVEGNLLDDNMREEILLDGYTSEGNPTWWLRLWRRTCWMVT
jgi:hypothetical protein